MKLFLECRRILSLDKNVHSRNIALFAIYIYITMLSLILISFYSFRLFFYINNFGLFITFIFIFIFILLLIIIRSYINTKTIKYLKKNYLILVFINIFIGLISLFYSDFLFLYLLEGSVFEDFLVKMDGSSSGGPSNSGGDPSNSGGDPSNSGGDPSNLGGGPPNSDVAGGAAGAAAAESNGCLDDSLTEEDIRRINENSYNPGGPLNDTAKEYKENIELLKGFVKDNSASGTLDHYENKIESGQITKEDLPFLYNAAGHYDEAERYLDKTDTQLQTAKGLTNNQILDQDRAEEYYSNTHLDDAVRARDLLTRAKAEHPGVLDED